MSCCTVIKNAFAGCWCRSKPYRVAQRSRGTTVCADAVEQRNCHVGTICVYLMRFATTVLHLVYTLYALHIMHHYRYCIKPGRSLAAYIAPGSAVCPLSTNMVHAIAPTFPTHAPAQRTDTRQPTDTGNTDTDTLVLYAGHTDTLVLYAGHTGTRQHSDTGCIGYSNIGHTCLHRITRARTGMTRATRERAAVGNASTCD